MEFDPVLLSRIQFAWVIGWHILLPAFTVGTASYIAVVEGLGFFTGHEVYVRVSKFWGYAGLPLAFATVWALALAAAGEWVWAGALLAVRMAMATAGGWSPSLAAMSFTAAEPMVDIST